MVPAPLRQKGVVAMLHPERIKARLGIDGSTEVGLGEDGKLVLRIPGGLLGSPKVVEIERGELTVTEGPEGVTVSGGPIVELVVRTDPASVVHRTWVERAPFGPGPDWLGAGSGQVFALSLDPNDPRKPVRTSPVGKPRSTTTVWRRIDGALRIDAVQEVIELPPDRIHAISAVPGAKAFLVHAFRPGVEGWGVGYRLNLGEAALLTTSAAPDAVVPARFVGRARGTPVDAALAVRTTGTLHLFDGDAVEVARAPLANARYAAGPRLLLLAPELDLVAELTEPVARWLVQGTVEDPDLLEIVGGAAPCATRPAIREGELVLASSQEVRVPIAELDPRAIEVTVEGDTARLAIGEVVVRGRAQAVARLRESVLAQGGRSVLDRAELGELYGAWQTLRVERWLWLTYGPVFLTDRLLEEAAALPLEAGEDSDRHNRRKLVAETLIVAEQSRAVRLRLGAAPVALPYALLEEEAQWLDAITGGHGASLLAPLRGELVDGFRAHLRDAMGHLTFALDDVERAVTRLEPVHLPELRGSVGLWGRVGLGAAVMLLEPISGTVTIASAVVGKVADHVNRDGTARVLVERFGPQCRTSWDLLVDVTGIAAAESRDHLAPLLARLAERDRGLLDELGPDGRARVREALIDRILSLRAARAVALDGVPGLSVGDIVDRMRIATTTGPRELVERLTGRGLRPATSDG